MAKLPVCSGEEAIKVFERAGWIRSRQKGSHLSLTKPGHPIVLTIPLHRELKPGLLRGLIRASGLTVDEFTELL
ncbi:MAG: type II toxin-antitoxin system HicA family toxin [Candidatus Binatia bacterium]